MTLLLAKDGIIPITRDKRGKQLVKLPASGLTIPGTIQGEGKLNGVPSLFIRLAGCNLHCGWQTDDGHFSPCDTAYAAYDIREAYPMEVEDICQTIIQNCASIRHLVITGGEPLLQKKELKILCSKLKQIGDFHITLETNATLFDAEVAENIDLFSLSPKLNSSHPNQHIISINPACIQKFITHAKTQQKEFQLKFVYACESDIPEIKELLSQLKEWQREDILLMPLGESADILRINTHKTLEHCIRNGWRFCERLHISLFGEQIGV